MGRDLSGRGCWLPRAGQGFAVALAPWESESPDPRELFEAE